MERPIATTLATITVLVLTAGCGASAGGPEIATPADGPGGTAGDPTPDAPDLARRCENPRDGYAIAYPDGWHTDGGEGIVLCRAFDPEPLELEPQTEIPLDTAVIVTTTGEGSLDEVAGEDIGAVHHERERTRVAGREAIVVDATGTGAALVPAGVTFRAYHIDLDHRVVVATSFDVGEPDLDTKRAALEAMVETIEPIPVSTERR